MEELRELQGNMARQALRPGGSLKPVLSGRSTPRGSPSFRRVHSGRTPRREGRGGGGGSFQWCRGNRLLLWLLLITLWAYLGFYVQSKWAHGDNDKRPFFGYRSKIATPTVKQNQEVKLDENELSRGNASSEAKQSPMESNPKNVTVSLVKKGTPASTRRRLRKTKGSTTKRKLRSKMQAKEKDDKSKVVNEVVEEEIPKRNTSYGLLVGPFGSTEDRILEWSADKRSGTCDRKSEFARLVWSRKFMLIFHELSMTGAPLSMMEMATELLSCGATVSAVVLSKKGGLMGELIRRKIKLLDDKGELSYKLAMKSDLVIAGSAVCAAWIEQYMAHSTPGLGQIAWWIMENRREYFDRAKTVLGQVKLLVFLSESQSEQWLAWCKEEGIELKSPPEVVPLSVNDELAFAAGISSSINTPTITVEKMLERKRLLRDAVRKEMGLTDNDMLVVSLSSINPGKGQMLLLESARLLVDGNISLGSSENKSKDASGNINEKKSSNTTEKRQLEALSQKVGKSGSLSYLPDHLKANVTKPTKKKVKHNRISNNHIHNISRGKVRRMRSADIGVQEQTLKLLVGSVGSKSNKILYVKGLLRYLSQHPELSKIVLWTPAPHV
ncbi:hypothetical protein Sjap_019401 [Stephania japonica]|uniref:Glycosyl transferase family 1 domain-containing protein n=1 Tax=Stephania japonica TaxID=461633 RepID=A0AAP0HY45_9MAGN